jgi:hypothetical protein
MIVFYLPNLDFSETSLSFLSGHWQQFTIGNFTRLGGQLEKAAK